MRALVRDLSAPSAKALQALGATLSHGSFDDLISLQTACAGITAVFLNPSPSFSEPDTELRHAINVVHAARSAGVSSIIYSGVSSIIYSSVCETGNHENFPDWKNWPADSGFRGYFLSKAAVENLVRQAGFQQYTIFRPPLFMTNFILPGAKFYVPELVSSGVLRTALAPSKRTMLMAPEDIGRFVAEAMLNPGKYKNVEMDIGGETLTTEQMALAIREVSGKDVTSEFIPEEDLVTLAKPDSQIDMQSWFWERLDKFSPRDLEEWSGIRLTSFKDFLMANKEIVQSMIP